jgi:hypothetical protein
MFDKKKWVTVLTLHVFISTCGAANVPPQALDTASTVSVETNNNLAAQTSTIEPEESVKNRLPYTINLGQSGKPYYHLMFELTAENVLEVEKLSQDQFKENGGQFELSIKKNAFPVNAPHCNGDIVLRMPWVSSYVDVSDKYELYQAIIDLRSAKLAKVLVAIELNPYIEKSTDGIQLQYCNVFFRHADKQYIPHINALN